LPAEVARNALGLFFDIDDTLTTHGKLTAAAYDALWRAHDAGLTCVAITGRPGGWCDHFARMWPVAGVVGENGGFYFTCREGKVVKRYQLPEATRQGNRRRLEIIGEEVLRRFPGAALASDQPYRELDLAIDFCEDVPLLPLETAEAIAQVFRAHGATAKISSIHVNGWFGEYDKLSMCRTFLEEQQGIALDERRADFFFVGDSPNDEPMFRFFPNSVAVANIDRFASRLSALPAYRTASEAGEGFAELVRALLAPR
jgi:HAD superfamily hydrolase (TIGR01484 family)